MAVIVRDGGKPPERKWNLFNTFYHVVKKREANRNLPDRKLSALLREGDKLLKSLHNNLGFQLHALAETSVGATTSLNKIDLMKLVKKVVAELQEEDVEPTIQTLMHAATDRLVLVSTPESGEFVRFDIRPLQEFFAAEHIHESGETANFIERLKTICGDSHWREVLHFLLSALTENNKKAEIAAAVTTLSVLDGDGEHGTRSLNRRLARGGIMVARLLQEGVLEQDRRLRAQFGTCLGPLLGCIDAHAFLSEVKAPHSRAWLLEILLSTLNEQAEHETIGATLTLSYVLEDSDPRTPSVIAHILKASRKFQAALFYVIGQRISFEPKPKKWLAEVALIILMDNHWHQLGQRGITGALKILQCLKGNCSPGWRRACAAARNMSQPMYEAADPLSPE